MKTLSVVTAFFAIAVHATGAYALSGLNGPSANGMSAAMPVAGVDANDMQVFSVVLPHAVAAGKTSTNGRSPNAAMRDASMVGVDAICRFLA